jgi:hypothetical protein
VNDLNPSNDNGEFHGFPIASPNRIIPFECIISFGHQGRGRVESFTVHHNRDSVPFRGVVIGRLEGAQIEKHNCSWIVFESKRSFAKTGSGQTQGRHVLKNGDVRAGSGERFIANVGDDPAVFARMMDEGSSCMGATGTVAAGDPDAKQPNLFVFDN